MSVGATLATLFGHPALADVLDEAWAGATTAWPRVELSPEAFASHVAPHLPAIVDAAAVRALCVRDLYLAAACAGGDPTALASFEREVLRPLEGALVALAPSAAERDEILQLVREKVFVGEPGRTPRIREYAGAGNLRAWLRVVAVRLALNRKRGDKVEVATDDETIGQFAVAADDPELASIKRQHREAFREAVKLALAALPPRDRTLLRQYFLDRLTIEQLGTIHGVHRATTARWVQQARDAVRAEVRRIFIERAQVLDDDADSVIALLERSLDVSVMGALRD